MDMGFYTGTGRLHWQERPITIRCTRSRACASFSMFRFPSRLGDRCRYPFLVDGFLCYFKIATCISTQPHVKSLLIKRQTTETYKLVKCPKRLKIIVDFIVGVEVWLSGLKHRFSKPADFVDVVSRVQIPPPPFFKI